MGKKAFSSRVVPSRGRLSRNPRRFEEPDYVKRLFTAGTHATALGIAVLDSQTRFEAVNASLARETRAGADDHVGRTSREIVGELAKQIEPTYENVLRTGRAESVLLTGHVRDTPEYGYWLDHCFPIFDNSGRVQQLGLFVVNISAERSTREILNALARDPKTLKAEAAGILKKFDQAIWHYHADLRVSFAELSCPYTQAARRVDLFRGSVQRLDSEISDMRELIYEFISHFPIPSC